MGNQLTVNQPPANSGPSAISSTQPVRRSNRGKSAPEYSGRELEKPRRVRPKRAKQAQNIPSSSPVSFPRLISGAELFDSHYDRVVSDESADAASVESEDFVSPEVYPWDDEVLALIETIITNPNIAQQVLMTHKKQQDSLENDRNINTDESTDPDIFASEIKKLEYEMKAKDETELYHKIEKEMWEKDMQKCSQGSEALFQRTIMIAMIDRYRLFYRDSTTLRRRYTFSTEKLWTCPPMPSRCKDRRTPLHTQPKPDLCISFRLQELIPTEWQRSMQGATIDLACFEGTNITKDLQSAFAFLTVEAKNAYKFSDDPKARYQNLNCASLALHNMYEFLRDAGQEDVFYAKARFFSAVATSKGIAIRVHRAVATDSGRIVDDYPLSFEFNEFWSAEGEDLNRQNVVDIIERIVHGYGATLFKLLRTAAEKIAHKFDGSDIGRNEYYYRHGQTWNWGGRKSTATSQAGDSMREGSTQDHVQKKRRTRYSNYT